MIGGMEHVDVAGIRVEYALTGGDDGPVVVLPHARPFVRWYEPLVAALAGRRVLSYRRPAVDGLTIARDAELAAALLEHVGAVRPHVVGHSYGGLVALALAMRAEVRSVALIEPATTGLLDPAEAAARSAGVLRLAADAGPAAAMGAFLQAVGGAGAAEELDRLVPGATADALANAAGLLRPRAARGRGPRVRPCRRRRHRRAGAQRRRLQQRVALRRSAAIVQSWLPDAERSEIPDVTHLLVAQRPDVVAGRLDAFWQRISS